MSWFCQGCGSPNAAGVPNCNVCGAVASHGANAAQASHQAAQQWSAAQQPWGGAQQQPWGAQPAPQQPHGAPAAQPPKPKADNRGLIAGCSIAGCLGFVLAIGAIFTIITLSSSSRSDDDDGGSDSRSTPSGELRDNIPKRVGSWKAKSAKPLKVDDAVDAVIVKYKSGSREILWAVAVFSNEEKAQDHLVGVTRAFADDSTVDGEVVRIKDSDGDQIGIGSHFDSNPEVLCYRIGKLMAVITGPRGKVLPFFRKLP